MDIAAYIGIDVQVKRGIPYAVLDPDLKPYASAWLEAPESISDIVWDISNKLGPVAIGIDSSRCPLISPRSHYWGGGKWRPKRPSDKGYGRHCEVVIAALKLANPQWTPLESACPDWMRYGFRLYEALSDNDHVYEVFPSASYNQLSNDPSAIFSMSLKGFARGVKDMLDAYVAAFTVHQYLAGRGSEVGGGDGRGTIILPRPFPNLMSAVHQWPQGE